MDERNGYREYKHCMGFLLADAALNKDTRICNHASNICLVRSLGIMTIGPAMSGEHTLTHTHTKRIAVTDDDNQ